jgi:excisionase family DNA binding protein
METPLSDIRFLTVAEVALIMRVSKMTVYRLVQSGELEAIRVGRSFRIPEAAVNQYLRASFTATGTEALELSHYAPSPGRATSAPPGPGFDEDDDE